MLISKETEVALNDLVQASFQANSVVDNYAYNLAYSDYKNIEEIVHKSFAHKFPEFADIISDLMLELNTRPVRKALSANTEDYEGNLYKIFEGLMFLCSDYRKKIISVIDTAEMNDDYEVKIKLEEFLVMFDAYRKQADAWFVYAKRYENDYKSYDVHFAQLTKFIDIE